MKIVLFHRKMVDISTWRCRIGTFTQGAKKYQSAVDTNKLGISCCYFVSFVVSIDLLVILCIAQNLLTSSLNFFEIGLIIQ